MLNKGLKALQKEKNRCSTVIKGGITGKKLSVCPGRQRVSAEHVAQGNCLDNAVMENFFGHLKEEITIAGTTEV